MRGGNDARQGRSRLQAFFRDQAAAADAEAPSYEDVEAYVDDTLDPDARELFELRLADDPLLQQEVDELRELRAALVPAPRLRGHLRPVLAAAAGLALVLWATLREPPGTGTGTGSAGTGAGTATPAALRDGAATVTVSADGRVTGLEALPADLRDEVLRALESGAVPRPEGLAALRGRAVVFMGPEGERPRFGVTAPVATLARAARPAFRWRPHPGARAYVVTVYDEDLRRLAASPELQATEWTPPADLPRQRTLLWQVAALTPAGRETTPAPPEPEARFRILPAPEAARLDEALAGAAGSRLARAVVLARHGIVDEARAELAALAEANPDSPGVRRLLDSLR